jgi:hypothetical protein
MSEPCTDKWHGTDKCPTCGMEDTGYDRGFRDGAARVAPSDGLREAIREVIYYDQQHPAGGGLRTRLDTLFNRWNEYETYRAALATTGQPDIERTAPGLDYRLRCTCVIGTVNGKHDSGCPEATAPYQPGTSYTARVMAEAGIPEATAPDARE